MSPPFRPNLRSNLCAPAKMDLVTSPRPSSLAGLPSRCSAGLILACCSPMSTPFHKFVSPPKFGSPLYTFPHHQLVFRGLLFLGKLSIDFPLPFMTPFSYPSLNILRRSLPPRHKQPDPDQLRLSIETLASSTAERPGRVPRRASPNPAPTTSLFGHPRTRDSPLQVCGHAQTVH